MAKSNSKTGKKATESVAPEMTKAAGQEVTFFIPNTESLGALTELQPEFKLNLGYKSADEWALLENKPLRAYYMGMKEIPNEDGELVNCALLVSQKECFISGQMTLIEAVRNLQLQTPIEITYKGKKANKSSKGSTMLFDVVKLG